MKTTGVIFSPPKRGKTLGLLAGLPCSLFLGTHGGLDSASWLDLDLTGRVKLIKSTGTVTPLEQVTAIIRKHGGSFPSIVGDDFTIILDMTYRMLEARHKANKFGALKEFGQLMGELMAEVDDAQCDIFFSAWEQSPKQTEKGWIPGTVQMPGWQWPEKFPGMLSFSARVVHDDSFKGWPFVYQVGPDAEYVTGSRYDGLPPRFPQNLGEILRTLPGKGVPRPKEFAWMEAVVEGIANQLNEQRDTEGFDLRVFLQDKAAKIATKVSSQRHIRWALKDGMDRAELRRVKSNMLDGFIDGMVSSKVDSDI